MTIRCYCNYTANCVPLPTLSSSAFIVLLSRLSLPNDDSDLRAAVELAMTTSEKSVTSSEAERPHVNKFELDDLLIFLLSLSGCLREGPSGRCSNEQWGREIQNTLLEIRRMYF